jgi:Kef-type K+ transport system membrane component KefB
MFEHKAEPLISRRQFYGRLSRAFGVTLAIVVISVGIGAAGYHYFAGLPWIDALLNAAMILTGMGPVDTLKSPAAKLFATFYALYSGVAFLSMMAVLLAPIIHRAMHKFHLDAEEDDDKAGSD